MPATIHHQGCVQSPVSSFGFSPKPLSSNGPRIIFGFRSVAADGSAGVFSWWASIASSEQTSGVSVLFVCWHQGCVQSPVPVLALQPRSNGPWSYFGSLFSVFRGVLVGSQHGLTHFSEQGTQRGRTRVFSTLGRSLALCFTSMASGDSPGSSHHFATQASMASPGLT